MSITRLVPALRANLIWLVVCTIAVVISTLFSSDNINAVTANAMFALGAFFGSYTLAKSAWIGQPHYDAVKAFVYIVAAGLLILGLESLARGLVIFLDKGDWYKEWLSAPFNIVKLGALVALLVVNALIQNRGHDKRLARTIAIGVGLATVLYIVLFSVVRAVVGT